MAALDNQLDAAERTLRWLMAAREFTLDSIAVLYKVYDDDGKDVTYLWSKYANVVQLVMRPPKPEDYALTKPVLDKLIAAKVAQVNKLRLQKFEASKPAPAAPAPPVKPVNTTGGLIYNVASVREAYLRPGMPHPIGNVAGFDPVTGNTKYYGGSPNFNTFSSADGNFPIRVQEALELWKNSSNHKGMISSWIPPKGTPNIDPLTVSGTSNAAGEGTFGIKDPNRYAFQFLYNPQPIEMLYRGAPPIDMSQYTSGVEEYPLWISGDGGGSISFSLMLSRMYDMPFYKSDGSKGYCTNLDIYRPGRRPYGEGDKGSLFNEQDAIYNKGTMYDIEFLLRTVLGIKMKSQLRGETADIGWIGALPVELHLGPGLRYWGSLSSLSVNHVMFNERMVPIFSTVQVGFNRIPDYQWHPSKDSGSSNFFKKVDKTDGQKKFDDLIALLNQAASKGKP